jgi:hypothetical protein
MIAAGTVGMMAATMLGQMAATDPEVIDDIFGSMRDCEKGGKACSYRQHRIRAVVDLAEELAIEVEKKIHGITPK